MIKNIIFYNVVIGLFLKVIKVIKSVKLFRRDVIKCYRKVRCKILKKLRCK